MPHTTKQVADLAGISESSVRNYTHTYKAFLSPAARGEAGNRLFTDEDLRVLCAIAAMRAANVPPAEIIAHIERGDVFIEAAPQQATTQAASPQEAPEAPQMLMVVRSDLQRQITLLRRSYDRVERGQRDVLRAAAFWGFLWGAITALAFASFVLWVLWLTAH